MASTTEQTLVGVGNFGDVDNNLLFPSFEVVDLQTEISSINVPMSAIFNNVGMDIDVSVIRKLQLGFHTITPEMFAVLYGGTATASSNQKMSYTETFDIVNPGSLTDTLDETPIDDGAVFVYKKDDNGNFVYFTQGAVAAAGVYTITGKNLVFAAADDGITVYYTYWHTGTDGTKVAVEADDMPGETRIVCTVKGVAFGMPNLQVVLDIPSVQLRPPSSFGASRDGHNAMTIDCNILSGFTAYFSQV